MRKEHRLVLFIGILLVLSLVLSACGQQTAPTSTTTTTTSTAATTATTTGKPAATTTSTVTAPPVTKAVEPVHKVLNPQGVFIPVETKPCAPRLDKLDGKKILYYESEATNMHMPTLLEKLKKDYPTTTFDVIHVENFGINTPTDDMLKTYKAVIRGVGW